jgi:hypothetical protein
VCTSLGGTVSSLSNNGGCTNVCCKPSTSGGGGGSGTGTPPATPPGFKVINGITFPSDTGLPEPDGGILQIVDNFFSWLLALFAILSIGAFIISGLQYLLATGDDKMIQTAKTNMKWSVVGVAVGLSGYLILKAVSIALTAEYNVF